MKARLVLPLSTEGTFFTFNSLQKPPCDSRAGQWDVHPTYRGPLKTLGAPPLASSPILPSWWPWSCPHTGKQWEQGPLWWDLGGFEVSDAASHRWIGLGTAYEGFVEKAVEVSDLDNRGLGLLENWRQKTCIQSPLGWAEENHLISNTKLSLKSTQNYKDLHKSVSHLCPMNFSFLSYKRRINMSACMCLEWNKSPVLMLWKYRMNYVHVRNL